MKKAMPAASVLAVLLLFTFLAMLSVGIYNGRHVVETIQYELIFLDFAHLTDAGEFEWGPYDSLQRRVDAKKAQETGKISEPPAE